jgi:hypothetical protein
MGHIYYRVLLANAAADQHFIDVLIDRGLPTLRAAGAGLRPERPST